MAEERRIRWMRFRMNQMAKERLPPTDTATILEANAAFQKIYLRLCQKPPEFLGGAASDSLPIRDAVQQHRDRFFETFNYEVSSNEFNRAFFLKNLYKCLLAGFSFKRFGYLIESNAIDVGGGAGPFALALDCLFDNRKSDIIVVDTSEAQLSLGRQVINILRIKNVIFRKDDFLAFEPASGAVRLASYWLCSQQDRPAVEVRRALLSGPALIVDYANIIADFISESPIDGRWIYLDNRSLPLPIADEVIFSDHEINLTAALFLPADL